MRLNPFAGAVLSGVLFGASPAIAQARADPMPIPLRFDARHLVTYRDSFAMVMNGAEVGHHVYSLARSGEGFAYTESVSMPGLLARELTVELDSHLTVLRARSEGQMQGRPMGSDVRYDGQRATGWAWVQRPSGPERVELDTMVAPGAFDGSALMALLPALDWADGTTYTLRLFDTDEYSTTEQTLTIVGPELVRVPAGEFRALRGDLTTTQAPVRIWVTESRPHRLVKVGGQTDAFATVLVRQGP